MTGWEWFAGHLDDEVYGLATEPTREGVIAAAMREIVPGETFRIVEARSSSDMRYEGEDFVPFLRTRNHEIIKTGPRPG